MSTLSELSRPRTSVHSRARFHFGAGTAPLLGCRTPSASARLHTTARLNAPKKPDTIELEEYGCDAIRNFSIIAHIDHGKSTLADRLLELTGTIAKKESGKNEQVLDKLKVERERGITVKAQTASMFHEANGKRYLLNLIDTPGHVDFAWEVSRSLAACQGAILLVDASQGIQAQSISVFHVARERGVKIVPVLNKIDLPASNPTRIKAQLESTFGIRPEDVLSISAKTGEGIKEVLEAIVERVPPPSSSPSSSASTSSTTLPSGTSSPSTPTATAKNNGSALAEAKEKQPLKALLFDSFYDRYRGVISLVSVQQGVLRKGDKIASSHTRKKYDVTEVGIMHPEERPTTALYPGQVGYVACNMKESSEAHIGDTLHRQGEKVQPMEGFKPTKAMVFAGIFPVDSADFLKLEQSIARLTLTDRSVTVARESSSALGQGCRLGFLGTLHMDVFRQRLEDEYDASVIVTAPTVPYNIVYKDKEVLISNPTDFPDVSDTTGKVKEIQEPIVKASIIFPEEYFGEMMDLCYTHRAEDLEHSFLDAGTGAKARIMLNCVLPLSEIVTDFFDQLKSRSSGFASFDYEDAGYKKSDLAKMMFLLNSKPVDALALVVHRSQQDLVGRAWVKKLHGVLRRQLFEISIQAAVGKKIIARETLSAVRADVTAGLYGGHYERKMKHLQNQKESKKKMKMVGNVELPQDAFFTILGNKK